PVIVQASLLAAVALTVQTGLAFLGLVVADPAPSWGGMIADGTRVINLQAWLIVPPGVVTSLTILSLGLLGDAVRDATTEAWSPAVRRSRSRRDAAARAARPCAAALGTEKLLSIEDLVISYPSPDGRLVVVDGVSFDVAAGKTTGIVGESGCGKTVTAMAIV